MDLIIVESPTKAKTLGKFLGSGYKVTASFGHVRDLPSSKMGIDIEHDFEPTYVQTDKQKEKLKEIKQFADEAKTVYLATDPDREGEAISFHIAELLKGRAKSVGERFKRIEFHEITKTAIEKALSHPRSIDMQLVDAQQARRVVDRLVGYKLSPLLWKKIRRGLSAGRVQSVALRLVVEKEREIEAFKPEEYWNLVVEVAKNDGKVEKIFKILLAEKDGKKFKVENGDQSKLVEDHLRSATYEVDSVEKKEFKRTPPAPFTTSTLQQTAANRLGWSAKKTMQVAQSLYEEGLITYHRTDSTNMAVEAIANAHDFIKSSYGIEFAVSEPRHYKTKDKVAQEAHEAIRPTDLGVFANIGKMGLNREQERLYELIWKRFLATQMKEVVGENLKIKVKASNGKEIYGLEAKGETVLFIGWQKLYEKIVEEDEEKDKVDNQELPEVLEGEKLKYVNQTATQKFTQPPARYNDAGLIKALEEMGIGRPSTYAPTISTILDRQYVEKNEKRFMPTALGIAVNDFLVSNFANIVDYEFTAKMEDQLDEIANGKEKWKEVITNFYGPFEKELGKVADTAERVKVEVEKTGEKCPECKEGDLVIRIGKFGKFVSCSRYPECKFKENYQNKAGMKCPKCTTGDVIQRKTKTGRTFFGCSNYPNCDFASWNKPIVEKNENGEDVVKIVEGKTTEQSSATK